MQWPNLATSVVTEVELPRAVARARENSAKKRSYARPKYLPNAKWDLNAEIRVCARDDCSRGSFGALNIRVSHRRRHDHHYRWLATTALVHRMLSSQDKTSLPA